MNINLNKISFIVLVLFFMRVSCFSAAPSFSASSISSCFGPRIPPTKTSSSFHNGIDYGEGKGTPIKAVEGGIISAIEHKSGAGWVIEIKGASGGWSYQHIFEGNKSDLSKTICVKDFILGEDNNGVYVYRKNLKYNDKKFIYLKDRIDPYEEIAPVGNSGTGTGPHLHLGLNYDWETKEGNNSLSQFSDISSNFQS